MAHGITDTDHMFSNQETPWHQLGTVTEQAPTLDKALKVAQLDWEVEKAPLFAESPSRPDSVVAVPGFYSIIRKDTEEALGVCKGRYTPVQNADAFGMLGALLDDNEAKIETAGSIFGGSRVWALARLGDSNLTIAGDEHIPYMLLVNGHNGGIPLTFQATPVRVVCNNTLTWALGRQNYKWKARHTASIEGRVAEARRATGLVFQYYEGFEAEVEKLIAKEKSDRQWKNVLDKLVPLPDAERKAAVTRAEERRATLESVYASEPFNGSAWGIMQAFSTVDLWGHKSRGETDPAMTQIERINTGATASNFKEVYELVK